MTPRAYFNIKEGRRIAYSVYNPTWYKCTAFYLHGTPSSHHEAFMLAAAARKYGLRIIAPSRPGFGGSSFSKNAALVDYAGDILALANEVGVKRFGIIAVSGGAPFAFACRKAISRERLVGMCIVAGMYPRSLGTGGMQLGSRVLLVLARWWPWFLEWVIDKQVAGGIVEDEKKVEEMLRGQMEGKGEIKQYEREMWEKSSDEMKRSVVMSVTEGVKYGGKGAAWEMRLLGSDWGFELDDDEVKPQRKGELVMWHGDRDENVPVGMARRAKEKLGEGADLRVVEGQAHGTLTMFKSEEIVQCLVGMLRG
ncbi:Alpha/Beta hydrolase protein [Cladorrhinum sp. PSN259]|nr:Alpha/Beta hydrolase protein [Cladorrhinum sp. PSN259]